MIVLDLQYLLVGVFIFCLSIIGLAIWGARYYHAPRSFDQKKLWAIIEQAPFGYFVLSPPQMYRQANACARHLLNLPSATGPLPHTDWAIAIRADWEMAQQERTPTEHSGLISLASNRIIQWSLFSLNHFGIVFIFDVTTQRRGELTARSLLNGLSHELRTPIGTILVHAEILGLPDVSKKDKQQSVTSISRCFDAVCLYDPHRPNYLSVSFHFA